MLLNTAKLNIFCFKFIIHKPSQSTDVPKGVEYDEECEADPGDEKHADTLPKNITKRAIEMHYSFKSRDIRLFLLNAAGRRKSVSVTG